MSIVVDEIFRWQRPSHFSAAGTRISLWGDLNRFVF